MIYPWVISRSVLYDLCWEDVLYPDHRFVQEVGETVGSALVLNDQPRGDGHQPRSELDRSLQS